MPKNLNDIKREIALKFTNTPEHQGNPQGELNDSHLCYYSERRRPKPPTRVLICVRYTNGTGLGIYFEPKADSNCGSANGQSLKHYCLEGLRNLILPEDFYLDESSVTNRKTGWVNFCRRNCANLDTLYEQIVDPGYCFEAWNSLYETLKKWMEDTFHWVGSFEKECLARMVSAAFTNYP